MRHCATVGIFTIVLGLGTVAQAAPDAATTFAQGQQLLAAGNFDGALDAYKAAAQADPQNDTYFQECALLKRVMNLRKAFDAEEDVELWQKIGNALYSYYQENGVRKEALHIASALHEKLADGKSAARLAEAQLMLDANEDALRTLNALASDAATARTRALQGIALARMGKADDARAVAAKLDIPKEHDPSVCFDAARLYALVGDETRALKMLQCSFEATPAPWLDAAKQDAKACPDLNELVKTDGFVKVCATESKVKASCGSCGSAAGCGGCSKKDTTSCQDKDKKSTCEHDKK